MVTVADRAQRIDAITPAICCTASGDKPPMGDEIMGVDTEWVGFMTQISLAQRLLEDEGKVVHLHPLKIRL